MLFNIINFYENNIYKFAINILSYAIYEIIA